MEIASFVLSIVAVLAAGASAAYTRQQARSASGQAIEAEKATAIEQWRFHADLTPQITLTCEIRSTQGSQAVLSLTLTGPAALDRLDEVRARIRDDKPRKPTPGSLQAEEHWDEVIWGPYRVKSGLQDTAPYGRVHGPFPLPKNEPYPIPLEESFVPPWQNYWQFWRDQYADSPVRLEITCIRDGHGPWVLTPEAAVHFPPEMMVHQPAGDGCFPDRLAWRRLEELIAVAASTRYRRERGMQRGSG